MTISQSTQYFSYNSSMFENNPGVYDPSTANPNPVHSGPLYPTQPGVNPNPGVDTYHQSNMSVNNIVDKFYEATYCWGTDDPVFNRVCDNINKDNVLDVMKSWNKYHSKEKGESFMQAFMADADHEQKVKYGKQIELALRDKAEELGIYNEDMAEAFARIDNELRSAYIGNDIAEQFDNILWEISYAEAEKAAEGETDPARKQEIMDRELEFSQPYDASDDTKGWLETACGAVGDFFDGIGDALFGWL
ncbi:MAG: hypothetical protein K6E29_01800 [Cyanobacteria bacterium RUI128]|nr:hypothetical protein [Cyanobacteria bacterium RUI128]